ncbi:transposase [Streptomyces viridiviolaceus]|uniref:Transposase n=1 Tax=Streptomyces viridiviolaceus TaxID=68282 RepID=A0ABW2E345_9ACTN
MARSFLSASIGRCGRWRDHRHVLIGLLHQVRTGAQRREVPKRFGPWKTGYERHLLRSADGT